MQVFDAKGRGDIHRQPGMSEKPLTQQPRQALGLGALSPFCRCYTRSLLRPLYVSSCMHHMCFRDSQVERRREKNRQHFLKVGGLLIAPLLPPANELPATAGGGRWIREAELLLLLEAVVAAACCAAVVVAVAPYVLEHRNFLQSHRGLPC